MEKLNILSSSPLYKQLADKLYADIKSGIFPVHSRFPSEKQLCESYGVSRVTVRKALLSLSNDGLLLRMQGKGTFVATPKLKRNLRDVTGFTHVCRLMGKTPSSVVLQAVLQKATAKDAQALDIAPNDPVLALLRVRLADFEPIMLETNVFSEAYAFLLQCDLTGSLYDLLAQRHIYPDRALHDISLCRASPQEAKALGITADEALLHLDEVIYDSLGVPIHTSCQVIRGDRFIFRI